MDEKNPKDVGISLSNLIELDKRLTSSLSLSATENSPLGHYRPHMKFLEYSCHGAFWIPGAIISLWFTNDPKKEAFCFNLLLGKLFYNVYQIFVNADVNKKNWQYCNILT